MRQAAQNLVRQGITAAQKAVMQTGRGRSLVYITRMALNVLPPADQPRGLIRGLLTLLAVVLLAAGAYAAISDGGISLQTLIDNREAIDAFVAEHHLPALLCYIGLYIVTVALSVPGAVFLTVCGGFLFGVMVGAAAAVLGATIGATLIFLLARTALGEPLLQRAGPRAKQLAQGFREDAFSYLLFLRLVPAFPFFLVNLVPAFAGVKLGPFVAATILGVIPAALVFAFAGTGLDSIIVAQKHSYQACLAAGGTTCRLTFDAKDMLTPQVLGALFALALLALVPVMVRRLRARWRVSS